MSSKDMHSVINDINVLLRNEPIIRNQLPRLRGKHYYANRKNGKRTAPASINNLQSAAIPIQNSIFISWSGDDSENIAEDLKNVLENTIFAETGLVCFKSDEDICSGTVGRQAIDNELDACSLGILCITSDNVNNPWIVYEATRMMTRKVMAIPLLIGCSPDLLKNSPLGVLQYVDFYSQKKFIQMIDDINTEIGLLKIAKKQLSAIAESGYNELLSKPECNTEGFTDKKRVL